MQEKKVAAKKESSKVVMDDALAKVVEIGAKEVIRRKKKEAHEEQYIDIEDEVAVLSISFPSLDISDGQPGTISIPTGERTKQGLPKMKRYELVRDYLPVGTLHQKIDVIPREEWETHAAETGRGRRMDTEMALRTRRAGDGR